MFLGPLYSTITDRADQSAFGIPRFVKKTKDVRGEPLKVRLMGLSEHAKPYDLHLFTITGGHETGAKHIVEVLHRFLTNLDVRKLFPRPLHVQINNCAREKTERYLFP